MPVAGQVALALAGIVALAATAWVAGSLALSSRRRSGASENALAVAVGLALMAQAGFLLALLGLLRPWVLCAAAVVLHWFGREEWRRLVVRARDAVATPHLPVLTLGVVAFVAAVVTMALYPPTAFDETLYHLPMARAFAQSGSLPFLPDLRFPAFPALAEVLFAELWLWGGELSTHAVSVVATLATAGLLFGWGRSIGRRPAGWLAAALYCGSPLAIYLAGTGYVEPVLALWTTGALLAMIRFRQGGDPTWRNLAALLAGSAAATKYVGLLLAAYVGLELLLASRSRGWRHVGLYGLLVAIAAVPCYVRIWWLTGSPLFPFYTELFGSSAWAADAFLGTQGGARWREAATALWDVVFRRERLGGLPPFSPVLPFLVPLVVWRLVARHTGGGRSLALFVAVFLAVAPMHGHYLATILPLLAIASAEAFGALADRLRLGERRRWWAAAAAALSLPGILYAVSWLWRFGPPPASSAARERYLEQRLPLYATVRALDTLAQGETAYGLFAENVRYYFDGRWLGDFNGPASYARVVPPEGDAAAFAVALRRHGVGYLVVPEAHALRLDPLLRTSHLELVRADGRGRLYRLREGAVAKRRSSHSW